MPDRQGNCGSGRLWRSWPYRRGSHHRRRGQTASQVKGQGQIHYYNIVSSVSGSDILSIIRVIDANMKEVDFMFQEILLEVALLNYL